jgi:hypothetical protein
LSEVPALTVVAAVVVVGNRQAVVAPMVVRVVPVQSGM